MEILEDRTLLAADPLSAQFQSATGLLSLHGSSAAHLVSASLSPGGYAQLAVAGQQFSADPHAADYDPALAGATGQTVHAIQLDGAPTVDHLVLGNWNVAGSLSAQTDGVLDVQGALSADTLQLSGHAVLLAGQVRGGSSATVTAANVLQSGLLQAGTVQLSFTGSYLATVGSTTTAGSQLVVDGGASGTLFTSGHYQGSAIDLFGGQVHLVGANVNASDAGGGGLIHVGGDSPADIAQHGGSTAGITFATVTTVDATTTLSADALGNGNGGHIVVWSQQNTTFGGTLSAHGAGPQGHGGLLEVSSAGLLTYGGHATAAGLGQAGQLLLDPKNLVISNTVGLPQFTLINPRPDPTLDTFGSSMIVLPNGNVAVADPTSGVAGSQAGAVFLYNGQTGALLATLTGAASGDQVGSGGLTALSSGNFVVSSPMWQGGDGAVTLVNGSTGLSAAVSASNSLVGSTSSDNVGSGGVTALVGGNYVAISPSWQNGVGAVTWGSGFTGITGAVSASNSLVGSTAGDNIGSGGVTALVGGNFVVASPFWQNPNGSGGAATWGNGSTGTVGAVSAANSLTGEFSYSGTVGNSVTALSDGNYVVASPGWNVDNNTGLSVGAATWGDGNSGTVGFVSAGNSLVGSSEFDRVGNVVTALTGGNYAVVSEFWNSNMGAVTWAASGGGTVGPVTNTNSLVGSVSGFDGDMVGSGGVTVLTSGAYVVSSPFWNNVTGAITWAASDGSTVGAVTTANSLTGANAGDQIGWGTGAPGSGVTALADGNYVVSSPIWNNSTGAVTWLSGAAFTSAVVGAGNSLTGSTGGDEVGAGGATALGFGSYVVTSPFWNNNLGAATWEQGGTSLSGVLAAGNSLVGSTAGDQVGSGGVVVLSNNTYVVVSPQWQNAGSQAGAATEANSSTGHTLDGAGTIDAANSLFGPGAGALLAQVVGLPDGSAFLADFSNNGGLVNEVLTLAPETFAALPAQTVGLAPSFLAATLQTGTAVVLQASNDITVSSPIVVNGQDGGNLTLEAGRSILINGSITTANGKLTLIANDTAADGVINAQRDPGTAVISMISGTALNAGTGNVTITLANGAGNTNNASGDITLGAITANNLSITNTGAGGILDSASVHVAGTTTLTAGGTIAFNNGASTFASPVTFTTAGGAVSLTAAGNLTLVSSSNIGALSANAGGTLTASGPLTVFGRAQFTGSTVTLTNPANNLQGPVYLYSTGAITLTDSAPLTVNFILALNGSATFTAPAGVTFDGTLNVGGNTLTMTNSGPARLDGNTILAGGTITDTAGVAIDPGVTVSGYGTLHAGTGSAGVLLAAGATIAPGVTGGGLSVNGDLTFEPGGFYNVQLNSATQVSQLSATGAISLGNATLQAAFGNGYTPTFSDQLQILTDNGTAPITGTFAQGGSLTVAGVPLSINYAGGNNNMDVVLSRTPPPLPVANIDVATVAEDSGATTINVLANDTGTGISVTSFTPAAHGSVAITGNGTTVTYQPSTDFFGVDQFTYTITDGDGQIATATVVVIVNEVAVAPLISAPASAQFVVNQSLAVPGISASDPNGGNPTVTATLSVTNGTLGLASTAGLTWVQGNGTATLVVTGPMDFVNFDLTTLSYLAKRDSAQTDMLTIQVHDTGGSFAAGVPLSAANNIVTVVADPGLAGKKDLIIQGTTGTDTIAIAPVRGAGAYTVTVNGAAQTVTGVTGRILVYDLNGNNNTISLTSTVTLPALIVAGNGNNTLTGGAGNDTIEAGSGSNTIDGGGGTANTLIESGDLDFTLIGGTATVSGSLTKGSAHDTLVKNHIQQVQLTLTGPDDHTIDGTAFTGNETLIGAAGNDTLKAGSGKDSLVGGTGNDLLVGGARNDTLIGGTGDDIIQAGAGSNTIDGGIGTNTLVESSKASLTLVGGTATKNGTLTKGVAKDTLILNHIQQVQLTLTGAGTINATAFSGPETLIGGSGSDTLMAGSGNDVLVGGTGNAKLVAGSGTNLLIAGSGTSTLIGGAGADLLIAGTTTYGTNIAALSAIMAEWTSGDDYATKIALLTGTQSGGLNGSTVLTNTTVQNNHKAATLTGGAGVDWFWSSSLDKITDLNNAGTETNTLIP